MKERITVTLDKELLSWLDRQIAAKVFANRSHGFEYLIYHGLDQPKENAQ